MRGVLIYFFPTIRAWRRKNPHLRRVFLRNIFWGIWTREPADEPTGMDIVDLGTVWPHESRKACPYCGIDVEIDLIAGHYGGYKRIECPRCHRTFTYYKAGHPG